MKFRIASLQQGIQVLYRDFFFLRVKSCVDFLLVFSDLGIIAAVIMKGTVYSQAPDFAGFQMKISKVLFYLCLIP